MSMRSVSFVNGEYYHIYNRGNSKQTIFRDDEDYSYFMNLLIVMNSLERKSVRGASLQNVGTNDLVDKHKHDEPVVSIGIYCLMPNHFHILLRQEKENGISLFLQKISTAYAMYFNKKYTRTGSLFEGKFKSKYAGEDVYLKYLFSYIHLNPLKLKHDDWKYRAIPNDDLLYRFIITYKYSSAKEYASSNFSITKPQAFPGYFLDRGSFRDFLFTWIKLQHAQD
jgi:putative transposase